MQDYIYLDHAAMSPVQPEVAEAMAPWLTSRYGNPSALYRAGREAAEAVERARASVAAALNCRVAEIVFTSGGSESINAALKGIAFAQHFAHLGSHIVVSAVEHHAVIHTCQYLQKFGFDISWVGVPRSGRVDTEEVARAVRQDTALVSIMLANNEVGVIQPIGEIAAALRRSALRYGKPIPFHTDAVQAPLWLPLDVDRLGVDALSLSAHKFGGPTGAGILYLRRGVPFLAQQSGGGQERQRRAGTEHVAGIVGAGAALVRAQRGMTSTARRVAVLRDRLVAGIGAAFPEASLNGGGDDRLPSIANFSFPHVEGERLVEELDRMQIAVSSGSACASVSWEPSHVLLAMGLTPEQATGAIRFSLGSETSAAEIDTTLDRLPQAVQRVTSVLVG